ncbi:MAG: UDP-N-acetylmuramoyl-L-alanyl-D-glutamate--2,6-diaminopimelate ligase [Lachnospiraceae bacterium]|nr:UDP-N-acetylmuramoyl-L-alanyl-D-glutamate--2,6-diaminopimelate ligase [Lachnospiraceae bacterium]MCH4031721.1 UDP-N-acetylmuramoyl-L-alanyl-D-glutamate--2,6-diaminopimelate ligase [Lachnospiraceae bacterium]MCH4071262.1 UDP-N-acetylmuramoyl-L-alanyl-D-glutamate--2,6-diaminopimelate ligase [Lachnospiraceae bacterium]MCH4108275.1 UDP-N-acetylmuramoyl-L-alanyl-D-glutamate--2,6-diaminopimelate ligase [Lachnospiraceae bacterium]MCI1302593.1 UDP-N-acetylmuramoyl-L-alanyl-D-glutamate--2,6-diaminopi
MKLCIDSRKVEKGDVFFCMPGSVTDGHRFAGMAADRGASVIVYQDELPEAQSDGVCYIRVPDVVKALNEACDSFYGHPSHHMKVFGVTGTSGKTTTAAFISQIFARRMPCGLISSSGISFEGKKYDTGLSTPEAVTLQTALKRMLDDGAKAAALEVSAHALAEGRAACVDFDVAVFTNLSENHLDFFGSMDAYYEAKKQLFRGLKGDAAAVLNIDSDTYSELSAITKARVISYGIRREADYRAVDIRRQGMQTSFTFRSGNREERVCAGLIAEFDIYNLLGAMAACTAAGMPFKEVAAAASEVGPVRGRMQCIDAGQPFAAIVDYAHTPQQFSDVFAVGKELVKENGRLIAVFGDDGGRDEESRHKLGAAASENCGRVILTMGDPGDEDPDAIAAQIGAGISPRTPHVYLRDRAEAVEEAVRECQDGDVLMILGRGGDGDIRLGSRTVAYPGDDVRLQQVLAKRR